LPGLIFHSTPGRLARAKAAHRAGPPCRGCVNRTNSLPVSSTPCGRRRKDTTHPPHPLRHAVARSLHHRCGVPTHSSTESAPLSRSPLMGPVPSHALCDESVAPNSRGKLLRARDAHREERSAPNLLGGDTKRPIGTSTDDRRCQHGPLRWLRGREAAGAMTSETPADSGSARPREYPVVATKCVASGT